MDFLGEEEMKNCLSLGEEYFSDVKYEGFGEIMKNVFFVQIPKGSTMRVERNENDQEEGKKTFILDSMRNTKIIQKYLSQNIESQEIN